MLTKSCFSSSAILFLLLLIHTTIAGNLFSTGLPLYLGEDARYSKLSPIVLNGTWKDKTFVNATIAVGDSFTLVKDDNNELSGVGYRLNGAMGDGNQYGEEMTNVPIAVKMTGTLKDKKIVQMASGYLHTIVLTDDNRLYSFGINT
jgi:hypothetical protein